MKDELENVLSDDERTRIHEILGRMEYHPYPVLDPPKSLWSARSSLCNCPDDDAWKRFVQKHRAEYARIFFEEVRKLKEREKDEQDNIQSKKG